jgi:FkbH-like protein
MYSFNELKKLSKKETDSDTGIKIALLADTATQFVHQAIKGYGAAQNVTYRLWEADYNQIDRQVFDPTSELYEFQPDFVVILRSSEHLLHTFYKTGIEEQAHFAATQLQYLESLYHNITSKLKCKVITNTYFELNDAVFGNYGAKVTNSFIYQVRKLNIQLMDMAREQKNLFLFDLAALMGQMGYAASFDPKLYINGDMVYNLEILPYIGYHIHGIIQSITGSFKKCLILDLDNTTWGGIIGDDGMHGIKIGHLGVGKAFTELQMWAKQLKNRGIILAVCSKNTEEIAREPFENHPDMCLRMEDIAVFVANWENKVDNIRHIQSVLNIGFDSMVFLDDNPFERAMVKEAIPALTVPDLPEDPAEYLLYLRTLNLFETASYTEEDTVRTKQYIEEGKRTVFQRSFENEAQFLESLAMKSEVAPFTAFTIPRVAQLTQRSNQFNLRTQRYTEAEVEQLAKSPSFLTFSLTLEDKFGNHGLISAVILEKTDKDTLFIDTWIMSCRVLKRGMEQFTLYCLANEAKKHGFNKLVGEYLPTPKNGIVKDHYKDLGFIEADGKWVLELNGELKNTSYIQIK